MRLLALLLVIASPVALAAQATPPTATAPQQQQPPAGQGPTSPPPFRNRADSFQLRLPAGWRQVAPNEARRIAENPQAPVTLTLAQPLAFYAVGPVDEWLRGDFHSPWLYVVESNAEWHVPDDFAEVLRQSWRDKGAASGERHEVLDVQRQKVGVQATEGLVAVRTCTPTPPRPVTKSLDVHVPARGQQFTFSFCCAPERFAELEPEFRSWLATLTFARTSRGPVTLTDRLWTPLVGGGAVALLLLVLYKMTRPRRG